MKHAHNGTHAHVIGHGLGLDVVIRLGFGEPAPPDCCADQVPSGIELLSFTGYLLPWDQLAYWAVTVGSSMADFVPIIGPEFKSILIGGDQVGEATLLRFCVLHVAVLPLMIVFVLMIHLWRWRKDSMLDQAREEGSA